MFFNIVKRFLDKAVNIDLNVLLQDQIIQTGGDEVDFQMLVWAKSSKYTYNVRTRPN